MNNEKRVYNKTGFFKQGNRTKEEQKAFIRDYMREYMRRKRGTSFGVNLPHIVDGKLIPCYGKNGGLKRARKAPGTATLEDRREYRKLYGCIYREKQKTLKQQIKPVEQFVRYCRSCTNPVSPKSYFFCGDHYNKIEE